jgi:hypothetical protein
MVGLGFLIIVIALAAVGFMVLGTWIHAKTGLPRWK